MVNNSLYKIPPQNIEAEQSVLSSCLITSEDAIEFTDRLISSDFYKSAHQKIFRAIISLVNKKTPTDLISVVSELRDNGQLEEIGGATYLATLIDTSPIATSIPHYSKLIKLSAVARQLIETTNKITLSAYESTGNIEEVLEKAQTDILNINLDFKDDSFVSLGQIIGDRVAQIEDMSKNTPIGIMTGFHDLDALTGGFWGSKLIIIAARPAVGKSSLMLNMAKHMAKNDHKIGIFSIEMDKEELIDRLIASECGINTIKLATGKNITIDDWIKINDAAFKIYDYPIIIDDTGGISIGEIKRRAKKMVKEGIEIIFIDQLSKIRGGHGDSEYEQRSYYVEELATLKKELRIPICLLAQINRKLEDRRNKKPLLSDLKSTGALEESSDLCILGYRKYLYTHEEDDKYHAEWDLAKQRSGPTRNIEMIWDAKTTTFKSIAKNY